MQPNSHLNSKKKNGIFYTPETVAQIMSAWAIMNPTDLVLEPSFGGCHFIEAILSRLTTLSSQAPEKQIFGCDIDPNAFIHLSRLIEFDRVNGNFIKSDFLKLRSGSYPVEKFNVVIGNPPYISHHNMVSDQILSGQKALLEQNHRLDGRASLWAYFVLHSLSFLADGGRIAWVLPSSFLYADYSAVVQDRLRLGFKKSLIIYLGERLFINDGTEEISIIVLCEGWNHSNSDGAMDIVYASDVNELETTIKHWTSGALHGVRLTTNPRLDLLSEEAQQAYIQVASMKEANRLGDLCKIQIGIVSGANNFFIINQKTAGEKKLRGSILKPILTRFNYSKGLSFSTEDFNRIEEDGHNCLLVDTSQVKSFNRALEKYLNSFPKNFLDRTTFVRRMKAGEWHRFNDNKIPDAFFPYMRKNGPIIILNEAGINCTNSIHRMYFEDTLKLVDRKAIAISILSTFSQLSAELEGRTYGAGVLKLEPSEALRITILLPANVLPQIVEDTFRSINLLLRDNKYEQARAISDKFVFSTLSRDEKNRYEQILKQALVQAQAQRLPEYSG